MYFTFVNMFLFICRQTDRHNVTTVMFILRKL